MNHIVTTVLAFAIAVMTSHAVLAQTATASATRASYPPNMVSVISPAYCSDIKGSTPIKICAPGLTTATVKCWKQGPGFRLEFHS